MRLRPIVFGAPRAMMYEPLDLRAIHLNQDNLFAIVTPQAAPGGDQILGKETGVVRARVRVEEGKGDPPGGAIAIADMPRRDSADQAIHRRSGIDVDDGQAAPRVWASVQRGGPVSSRDEHLAALQIGSH